MSTSVFFYEVEGRWCKAKLVVNTYRGLVKIDIDPFLRTSLLHTTEEAWEMTFEKWYLIRTMVALVADVKDYELHLWSGGKLTCGLCSIYWKDNCEGCPVRIQTGHQGCEFTPHERFDKYRYINSSNIKYLLSIIQEEIDFLQAVKRKPESSREKLVKACRLSLAIMDDFYRFPYDDCKYDFERRVRARGLLMDALNTGGNDES